MRFIRSLVVAYFVAGTVLWFRALRYLQSPTDLVNPKFYGLSVGPDLFTEERNRRRRIANMYFWIGLLLLLPLVLAYG